jgi:hypothetical protein
MARGRSPSRRNKWNFPGCGPRTYGKRECEILKKSGGVLRERCAVKYAWIDTQRETFDLAELCAVLDVSVSGYRAWTRGGTPDRKRLTDAQMLTLIRAIHAEFKGAYGSPRMVREL